MNPNMVAYHHYGGRGIEVCERWRDDFFAFLKDMGPRPTPEHQIERIDNDGNYEPGNCRWATIKEQALNRRNLPRRNNRLIEWGGRTQTEAAWARELGMRPGVISRRLDKGYSVEEALSPEMNFRSKRLLESWQKRSSLTWIEAFGERRTLRAWSAHVGIEAMTIRARLLRGWSPEDALSLPLGAKGGGTKKQ